MKLESELSVIYASSYALLCMHYSQRHVFELYFPLFLQIILCVNLPSMSAISDHLSRGMATSKELQVATGLSQSAVSRALSALKGNVVRIKRGKAYRYGLTRNAFGVGDSIPLFSVDPHGNTFPIADIRPLAHGGFIVERTTGTPSILLGERQDGYFDDLPFFLEDLRPQGFLGRKIARAIAERFDFPDNPNDWTAEQIGRFLIANGDDLPGNLVLGEQAYMRLSRRYSAVLKDEYPAMAQGVIGDELPGSSAAGEQPKFAAYTEDLGHVIVKFSPDDDSAAAKRWRDILLSEYHAANVLHKNAQCPAAKCNLFESGGRLFLESQRIDRHGEQGRLPMISLRTVDAEYTGIGSKWIPVMEALQQQGRVTSAHLYDTVMLDYFGRFINNTDRHLGNLSLAVDGDVFRLLPVYDMCSMGFAPLSTGEVRPYGYSVPELSEIEEKHGAVGEAKVWAEMFWGEMRNDPRISDELKIWLDV